MIVIFWSIKYEIKTSNPRWLILKLFWHNISNHAKQTNLTINNFFELLKSYFLVYTFRVI